MFAVKIAKKLYIPAIEITTGIRNRLAECSMRGQSVTPVLQAAHISVEESWSATKPTQISAYIVSSLTYPLEFFVANFSKACSVAMGALAACNSHARNSSLRAVNVNQTYPRQAVLHYTQ